MDNRFAGSSIKWPMPVTILREGAFLSLAGAGVSIIIVVKTQALWARELIPYLVCPLLAFGFLYIEYKIVEALIKRELNLQLGYVQAIGCVAIALYGAISVVSAGLSDMPAPPGVSERVLVWLCFFGEGVFLANVIRSYLRERAPERQSLITNGAAGAPATVRIPPPVAAKLPTAVRPSDWPNSPSAIFGIAAIFFAGMGIVFAKVAFPGSQVWIAWNGNCYQVPAIKFCPCCALPFAVFAIIYFLRGRIGDWTPMQSATRIHFVCTLLAVMEAIRVYLAWAETWANTTGLRNPVRFGDFGGAFALGALALGCFAWNLASAR